MKKRFWLKVKKLPNGCWEWQGSLSNKGYGQFKVLKKLVLAHRFAYESAHGPIPKGKVVCHKCDNRKCCNPEHLFLGTYKDNTQDMIAKGRNIAPPIGKGEANSNAKLTDSQVAEIRNKYVPFKVTARMLAEEYGVTREQIDRIVNNRQRRTVLCG